MRVLICGGRDYPPEHVVQWLNAHMPKDADFVISGGATGADAGAEDWAKQERIDHTVLYANWDKYGASAGSIRNQRMLEVGKPDLVIAFPGGVGTKNMMEKARKAGVTVWDLR